MNPWIQGCFSSYIYLGIGRYELMSHILPHNAGKVNWMLPSCEIILFCWSVVYHCFIAHWIHPVCSSEEGRTPCPSQKNLLFFWIDHCSTQSWFCSPSYQMISLIWGMVLVKMYCYVSHLPLCLCLPVMFAQTVLPWRARNRKIYTWHWITSAFPDLDLDFKCHLWGTLIKFQL